MLPSLPFPRCDATCTVCYICSDTIFSFLRPYSSTSTHFHIEKSDDSTVATICFSNVCNLFLTLSFSLKVLVCLCYPIELSGGVDEILANKWILVVVLGWSIDVLTLCIFMHVYWSRFVERSIQHNLLLLTCACFTGIAFLTWPWKKQRSSKIT